MNIYFSDVIEVAPALLEQHGAFNISLVSDLPLFIDPFLLFNGKTAEYRTFRLPNWPRRNGCSGNSSWTAVLTSS